MFSDRLIYPKTVSFIVLALNEAPNIDRTVKTVINAVAESSVEDWELVLVNDGSNDGTGDLMDQIASKNYRIYVVHNEKNLGFGGAYLKGVEIVKKEYIMIIAGDNIMPAQSITQIINSIGISDMLLPYMTDAKYRDKVRSIGSWTFARIINILSGTKIRYYNSMVVRRALFSNIQVRATGYTLQAECVIKFIKNGATYYEIGVSHGHQHVIKTTSHALKPKNLLNVFVSLKNLFYELSVNKKNV